MRTKEPITPSRPFKVFAIKNGTVIDHVQANRALTLVKVLDLTGQDKIVSLGLGFKSKKYGFKDLIKVEDKELSPEEVNQVAILVPTATINIIRNCKVFKKFKVSMPEEIKDLIACPNPKCITNNESVRTKFYPVLEKKDKYNFQCHYCERVFPEEEIIGELNNQR